MDFKVKKDIKTLKFEISTKIDKGRETVKNFADEATHHIAMPFYKLKHTWDSLKVVGVVVLAITAPIPTIVALTLFSFFECEYESFKENKKLDLERKKKDRKLNRIVEQLNKYGKIPENAIVESQYLKMKINTKTGEVDGKLTKIGLIWDSEVLLSALSDDEILEYGTKCDDSETLKLLDAYLNHRARMM